MRLLVLSGGGELVNDVSSEVELLGNLPAEVLVNFFIMVIIADRLPSNKTKPRKVKFYKVYHSLPFDTVIGWTSEGIERLVEAPTVKSR